MKHSVEFNVKNLRANQNNQIILKKKNKVTKLTLPDLKTYCKATVIRQCGPGIGWTREQYGRTESPEITPTLTVSWYLKGC